jgi:glycosyltransferase involved in cell wall biosynthesis
MASEIDPGPEATVVIPNRDGARMLADCLAGIDAQTVRGRLRVIVVDNCSVDTSVEVARRLADTVVLTAEPGPAGPRNRGLSETSTPFLLSLDADCLPARDWAERHLEALRSAPEDVLATAGRLAPPPGGDRWAARSELTPHPRFSGSECLYAVGGNACFRTELLRDLGGFPLFPVGPDDALLGRTAREAGFRFKYEPSALVVHRNPAGWLGYARQMRKVGRYAADVEGAAVPAGRLLYGRTRMLAGAARRLREPGEALASATQAVAGGIGALDSRRAQSARRGVRARGELSVSVALATYNGERHLEGQLASLARQAKRPDEVVIGDDGSTDGTWEILTEFERWAPFPVRLYRNARPSGHVANFLETAARCTGQVIAFCDQDDVWLPAKLARTVPALAKVSLVAHSAEVVDRHLVNQGYREPELQRQIIAGGSGIDQGHFLGFTLCFRRELLEYIPARYVPGIGDPAYDWGHDHWVCFLAKLGCGIATFPEPLALYRQHGSNSFGSRRVTRSELAARSLEIGAARLLDRARVMRECADLIASARAAGDLSPLAVNAGVAERGYRRASELLLRRARLYAEHGSARGRFAEASRLAREAAYDDPGGGGLGSRAMVKDALVTVAGPATLRALPAFGRGR